MLELNRVQNLKSLRLTNIREVSRAWSDLKTWLCKHSPEEESQGPQISGQTNNAISTSTFDESSPKSKLPNHNRCVTVELNRQVDKFIQTTDFQFQF